MTQEIIEKPMSAECTMKQYESISDSDFVENREYQLTDYPDNGANATQMAYALTCKRLFPAGTVVTFSGETDSNYINGHLYQIEVDDTGTKSWKDITPISEQSIPLLTGTTDNPINVTTLERGKYYLLQGTLKFGAFIVNVEGTGLSYVTKGTGSPYNYLFIFNHTAVSSVISGQSVVRHEYAVETGERYSSYSFYLSGPINGTIPTREGIYAPESSGTAGQILQSKGNNPPQWVDMPEQSIPVLTGTAEKPINLHIDLQERSWYIITGKVRYNESTTIDFNNYLVSKTISNAMVYGQDYDCWYMGFDEDGNISLRTPCCQAFKLNNRISYTPAIITDGIYAPESSGTAGQILESNGLGAPTWVDPATLGLATTADIEAAIGNVSALLGNTEDLEV